jgi:hypothetical protein
MTVDVPGEDVCQIRADRRHRLNSIAVYVDIKNGNREIRRPREPVRIDRLLSNRRIRPAVIQIEPMAGAASAAVDRTQAPTEPYRIGIKIRRDDSTKSTLSGPSDGRLVAL